MNVREIILEKMRNVAEGQDIVLPPLTDDLGVLESGLTSLCVAILVADLEDELNLDPFSTGDDTQMPVTIGEFIALYENAVVVG